jgi:hypothetical protein
MIKKLKFASDCELYLYQKTITNIYVPSLPSLSPPSITMDPSTNTPSIPSYSEFFDTINADLNKYERLLQLAIEGEHNKAILLDNFIVLLENLSNEKTQMDDYNKYKKGARWEALYSKFSTTLVNLTKLLKKNNCLPQ